jgi:hypothetical protein
MFVLNKYWYNYYWLRQIKYKFVQRHLVTQRGAIVAAMKLLAESRSQPAGGQQRQESFQYSEQDRTLVSIDAHRQVSLRKNWEYAVSFRFERWIVRWKGLSKELDWAFDDINRKI